MSEMRVSDEALPIFLLEELTRILTGATVAWACDDDELVPV